MYHFVSLATVVFAAASSVSGLAIPRDTATPPAGWLTDILEPYANYHKFYLSANCEDRHNTTFFDECCHPRLAAQSLDEHPPQCTSSSASLSAPIAEPTSSAGDDEEDCDDEDDEPSVVATTTAAPKVVTTPAPKPITTAAPKVDDNTPAPKPATTAPPIQKVVPSTTHEAKPATTSTTKKAASTGSSSSSSSGSSQVNSGGIATFFFQNGVAGACGTVHKDSDFIVAMDSARYGNSGNSSPLCGKQVHITNVDNGKTVTATVADDCPTCNNDNSIDLSVATFNAIGDPNLGELPISWFFV